MWCAFDGAYLCAVAISANHSEQGLWAKMPGRSLVFAQELGGGSVRMVDELHSSEDKASVLIIAAITPHQRSGISVMIPKASNSQESQSPFKCCYRYSGGLSVLLEEGEARKDSAWVQDDAGV